MTSNLCPDGGLCDTWFAIDGTLICRHGVVQPSSGTTGSVEKWVCPLELQAKREHELFSDLPKAIEEVRKQYGRGDQY